MRTGVLCFSFLPLALFEQVTRGSEPAPSCKRGRRWKLRLSLPFYFWGQWALGAVSSVLVSTGWRTTVKGQRSGVRGQDVTLKTNPPPKEPVILHTGGNEVCAYIQRVHGSVWISHIYTLLPSLSFAWTCTWPQRTVRVSVVRCDVWDVSCSRGMHLLACLWLLVRAAPLLHSRLHYEPLYTAKVTMKTSSSPWAKATTHTKLTKRQAVSHTQWAIYTYSHTAISSYFKRQGNGVCLRVWPRRAAASSYR